MSFEVSTASTAPVVI